METNSYRKIYPFEKSVFTEKFIARTIPVGIKYYQNPLGRKLEERMFVGEIRGKRIKIVTMPDMWTALRNPLPGIRKIPVWRNPSCLYGSIQEVDGQTILLYYDDLDGDGKPELGIKQESFYIFDYKLGESEIRARYITSGFGKMLGAGQIWCHYEDDDSTSIRDDYIVLNDDNKWEALKLWHKASTSRNYYVETSIYRRFNVGKENWNEITKPFFDATEHGIPEKTFEEIFGELLIDNG